MVILIFFFHFKYNLILLFYYYYCLAITNYPKITVSEYGTAYGDDQIMAEIYARGPVAAYIDAVCSFLFYYYFLFSMFLIIFFSIK